MTPGLNKSLRTKAKLYKHSLEGKDEGECKKYKRVFYSTVRKSKQLHYKAIVKEAEVDSKKIWRIVNEVINRKQCKRTIPINFEMKEDQLTTKDKIANTFNSYFAN